jgi:hypothetical protein
MSAEIKPGGHLERAGVSDGVLRRPDRSIDIRAYAAIAHRQRAAAIQALARAVFQFASEAWSAISSRPVHTERPIAGASCVQTRR